MARFKVGDIVRVVGNTCSHNLDIGTVTSIMRIEESTNESNTNYYYSSGWCVCSRDIVLESNKNNMNIKEKFALLFKGEPEKSFIQAGIMNTDETLTSEGKEIWTAWLVKKFGTEFKTDVVDKLLEEDKKITK